MAWRVYHERGDGCAIPVGPRFALPQEPAHVEPEDGADDHVAERIAHAACFQCPLAGVVGSGIRVSTRELMLASMMRYSCTFHALASSAWPTFVSSTSRQAREPPTSLDS